jgi:hypothetical protein
MIVYPGRGSNLGVIPLALCTGSYVGDRKSADIIFKLLIS